MQCPPEEMLTAFADGELAGRERRDVEKHVHECARCAETVRAEQGLAAALTRHWQAAEADRASEGCPSDEELCALVDGSLAPSKRPQLERHLAECNKCVAEVAALFRTLGAVNALPTATPRADRAPQPTAPSERRWFWPRRRDLGFAVAGAAAALILVLGWQMLMSPERTWERSGTAMGRSPEVAMTPAAEEAEMPSPAPTAPSAKPERLAEAPVETRPPAPAPAPSRGLRVAEPPAAAHAPPEPAEPTPPATHEKKEGDLLPKNVLGEGARGPIGPPGPAKAREAEEAPADEAVAAMDHLQVTPPTTIPATAPAKSEPHQLGAGMMAGATLPSEGTPAAGAAVAAAEAPNGADVGALAMAGARSRRKAAAPARAFAQPTTAPGRPSPPHDLVERANKHPNDPEPQLALAQWYLQNGDIAKAQAKIALARKLMAGRRGVPTAPAVGEPMAPGAAP